MDLSFWKGRRVLVTGHTGFKGAWLTLWLERLGARVIGLALPPERRSEAFGAMGPWDRVESSIVDLRDPEAVGAVVKSAQPEVVLHLGAQALVRRGYRDPVGTYATNVMGTVNLLRAIEATPSVAGVVVVTSDKVYAHTGGGRAFVEEDPLGHTDPYSNSKACTELVTACWRASYLGPAGVAVSTARAGNVIGGGDEAEDRLLPDIRRALASGDRVLLRNPDAIRPWQHVIEPIAGYLRLAEALVVAPADVPPAVNFGPPLSSCQPVHIVVERVLERCRAGQWAMVGGEQPPEAVLLELDSSLAERSLGWHPRLDLDGALNLTVAWWQAQDRGDDMRAVSVAQLVDYEQLMGTP